MGFTLKDGNNLGVALFCVMALSMFVMLVGRADNGIASFGAHVFVGCLFIILIWAVMRLCDWIEDFVKGCKK
jgi:hypothetical protein